MSAPVVAPAPTPARPADAWRSLPPIPTTGRLELTAPVQRLSDGITPHRPTSVASEPMGHDRSPLAPAGMTGGLVRARHGVRATGTAAPMAYATLPEPEPDPVPLRSTVHRLPEPVGAGDSAASPASPPSLPAMPVRPLAASAAPVTSVRSFTPPAPLVQRLPAAETSAPHPSPPSSSSRISAPGAEHRDHEGGSAPTPAAAPVSAPVTAPLIGATRVVRRVGEPVRERPPTMHVVGEQPPMPVVERPAPSPVETARSAPPPPAPGELPRPDARPARAAALPADVARPATRSAAIAAARPGAPLVGQRPMALETGGAPALTAVQRMPDDESVPTAVPVRREPVQRLPDRPDTTESVPHDVRAELEPVLGTRLDDVKVNRGGATDQAARDLKAKAFTTGGEVHLPSQLGSTAAGPAREVLRHELVHVDQQRRLGSSLPSEDTPEGARLEQEARHVAQRVAAGPAPSQPPRTPVPTRPVAAGPAQRLPGTLPDVAARRPAAAPPSSGLQGAAPVSPAAAQTPRSAEATTGASGMSQHEIAARVFAAASQAGVAASVPHGVQRAVQIDEVTVSPMDEARGRSDAAAPVSEAVPTSTQAANGGGGITQQAAAPVTPDQPGSGIPTGPQLEELARVLYPKFRTRLRRELLADRERAGRLFDVR